MAGIGATIALIKALAPKADPAVIQQAVEDYLEAHPEISVADGSITEEKLAADVAGILDDLQDDVSDVKNAIQGKPDVDDTAGQGDTNETWSANKLSGTGLRKVITPKRQKNYLVDIQWESGYVYNGAVLINDSYEYMYIDVAEGDEIETLIGKDAINMRFIDLMNGATVVSTQQNISVIEVPSNVNKLAISVLKTVVNDGAFNMFFTHTVNSEEYMLDIVENAEEEGTPTVTSYADNDLEWHNGVMYSSGTEFTGGSFDNYHYCYLDVEPGDTVTNTDGAIRDICTYDGTHYFPYGEDRDASSFYVPDLVTKIAITRFKTHTNPITITHPNINKYHVITEKALGKIENAVDGILENKDNAYVKPENATFFHESENLIDPDKAVDGQYVNQGTGNFESNSIHSRTDYIAVSPSTEYVIRLETGASEFRYAFYNSNKIYISGALMNGTDMIITSPSTASYIVISLGNHYVSTWMLKEYKDNTDFEPFDNFYIQSKYITTEDKIIMNLPSKVYALVGYECNIYFENLVEDWTKYKWNITCTKGMQLERGYRITPVSGDVGSYTLTIDAELNDKCHVSKTATLIITGENARSGESDDVMILGDSTTNNGIAVTKLNANLENDVYSISTIGTRGTSPNNHEGRSGWTFAKYFQPPNAGDIASGVENPWYNTTTQTFDADFYFDGTGIAKPDWFIINLGINDTFSYTNDEMLSSAITTIIGLCDDMIESMNSASENTKIGICLTIPPNHSQDAFGKAYKCGQTRDRYKRNNVLFVNAMIKEYDNREDEGIYIIPIYANLDTVYNMGMETLAVNARNTSITYQSPIENGGVHPVDSGYWQIADVYTAFLKANG